MIDHIIGFDLVQLCKGLLLLNILINGVVMLFYHTNIQQTHDNLSRSQPAVGRNLLNQEASAVPPKRSASDSLLPRLLPRLPEG
jgi:hypothetical protein